jgi:ABC-type nitrate/sulfonate/bicarbonate transport system substrate-binding protein
MGQEKQKGKITMKKFITTVLICFVAVFALCGCGSDSEKTETTDLTDVTFVLDWTPNTNHTGIYVAQAKGYFEEQGLNVEIMQPPENGATSLVASGGADFGVDFQDYLADAFTAEEPLPVTAVAAILQHNTSGIVSLRENNITSPAAMADNTYATWNMPIELAVIRQVVEDDGGNYDDIEMVPSTVTDVPAALMADIDSVWIYYGWEGIACEQAGIDTNFFFFTDIDEVFDYYSPVIIANNEFLAENPDVAKAFLAAVKKGYEFAIENPEKAAEILCEEVPELDKDLVLASQQWLADRYQADASSWGLIDADRWNGFYAWLNKNDLTAQDIPANYGFSNDYLK